MEQINTELRRGSSLRRDILFLLGGGLIGAATALLFAPKAGNALRGDIADATRKTYDGSLELAKQLRGKAETAIDTASRKFKLIRGKIEEDTMDQVREVMDDPILPLVEVSQSRVGGNGRRASNIL